MYLEDKKALLKLKKTLLVSQIVFSGTMVTSSFIPKSTTVSVIYNYDYISSSQNEIEYKVLNSKFYDCSCPLELQEYIFEKCEEYNVPDYVVMTIIEQESNGTWATNGVVSITNDYGLSQINICNLELIEEVFGYTKDDILNDPYKNIEAAIYLIKNIINKSSINNKIDIKNVFGMYNGWSNWESIEDAVKYADSCMNILETKFSKKIDNNKIYIKGEK